jgi:hypothetical protein
MNYDKTNFMQFTTKNSPHIDLDISYANILIDKAYNTRFLGIHVVSTLSWKNQAEQMTHLPINIKELSYDVKRFKPVLKTFFQINSFYSLEEYFNSNPQL